MEKQRDYIKLKRVCAAVGISYMKVYNNIRTPSQDTLTSEEKTKIITELDRGILEFKNTLK